MSVSDWATGDGKKQLDKLKLKNKKTTKMTEEGDLQRVKIGAILYVNVVDKPGWVDFILTSTGERKQLYKYAKLKILGFNKDETRIAFQVLEGIFEGQYGSMKVKDGADKYLGTKPPLQTPAIVKAKYGKRIKNWPSANSDEVFDQQMASFEVNGKSFQATLNSDWRPEKKRTPLSPDRHEIHVPDFPHRDATVYRTYPADSENGERIPGDTVWFPIVPISEERYLHMGQESHGCFTVLDFEQYDFIYEYLIKHRAKGKNEKTIIGYLEISK